MSHGRLDVPLRLARQALDHARLDLARAATERRALERALADLRAARARETFRDVPELHLLAAYRERTREIERGLSERLRATAAREADLGRCLDERRLALRKLELLADRRLERSRAEAARRERRELDDLVAGRHGGSARRAPPVAGAVRTRGRGSP